MAKLDDTVRAFIVKALACYDTPTQVADAVREEFGLTLTRMQVQAYDPTKAQGKKGIAKKWRDLFDATRKRFLENVSEIPIANQATRLRTLDRLLRLAEKRSNALLAAQLLEQAAKEVGGAYTDRRRIVGDPSQPVGVQHGGKVEHVHSLADAELERIARG
jgi:hypothetical protein